MITSIGAVAARSAPNTARGNPAAPSGSRSLHPSRAAARRPARSSRVRRGRRRKRESRRRAGCAALEAAVPATKHWRSKLTKMDPRSTGNYPPCTLAQLPASTRCRCLICPAHPASHRFDPLLTGRRYRRARSTTATDKAVMTAVATQTAARSATVGSARLSQTSIFALWRRKNPASPHASSVCGRGMDAVGTTAADTFP